MISGHGFFRSIDRSISLSGVRGCSIINQLLRNGFCVNVFLRICVYMYASEACLARGLCGRRKSRHMHDQVKADWPAVPRSDVVGKHVMNKSFYACIRPHTAPRGAI